MSLLLSLQRNMIRFHWLIDMSAIFWRICLMIFFCIFSISSLSAIFIMTLHLLQSDDDFSLKCCFLINNSSLVTFVHDMIFDEKLVFFCICNCLLSSWTDVFSFYTFFVMNAFESCDVFLLNRVEDDTSASVLFLFISNLCSSFSLTLMSLLVNQ